MKIKPKPKVTRKQKAYLKWMGLVKPKSKGRLSSLNKFNRKMKRNQKSEFVAWAERDLEERGAVL